MRRHKARRVPMAGRSSTNWIWASQTPPSGAALARTFRRPSTTIGPIQPPSVNFCRLDISASENIGVDAPVNLLSALPIDWPFELMMSAIMVAAPEGLELELLEPL